MENIIELANKIGNLIKASDEMKRVNDAQAKFDSREDLQNLIEEYNAQNYALRDEKIDQNTRSKIEERLNNIYEQVVSDKDYVEYVDAQKELSALMNSVNDEINYVVTGHRSCSHDCSCCSGCEDECGDECGDDCGCGCGCHD